MDGKYIYCFVRKDISIVQQIIQMSHAAHEAGRKIGAKHAPPSIVLFEVQSQKELMDIFDELYTKDIECEMFYEPDNQMGYSALCTEPLDTPELRKHFERYNLYREVG